MALKITLVAEIGATVPPKEPSLTGAAAHVAPESIETNGPAICPLTRAPSWFPMVVAVAATTLFSLPAVVLKAILLNPRPLNEFAPPLALPISDQLFPPSRERRIPSP